MRPRRSPVPNPDDLLVAGALVLNLHLEPDQVEAFRVYRAEILRWSARTNLTALRDPEDIVRAGFLDSLACAPLIPSEAERVVDIGSGAGFPAVPLKLVRPHLSLTLVEASRKKVTFLLHVVRRLRLAKVRVVQARAEAMATDAREVGAYDLALARAVAPPLIQGRLVRPFLRIGGLFLLQIGTLPPDEEAAGRLSALGFEVAGQASPPPIPGRPGRRVLALRRVG